MHPNQLNAGSSYKVLAQSGTKKIATGRTARLHGRLEIFSIVLFVVCSRLVKHLVDATLFQCFLSEKLANFGTSKF